MSNHRGSTNYRTVPAGSPGQGEIIPPVTTPVTTPEDSLILDFAVSSHRLLAVDTLLDKIVYADKDVLHHALNIIGITLNAALPGDPAYYAFSGKIVGVAGLVAGRVWLGNNGELTQVVPTVGIILCVGTILEDDSTLVLNIGHSIIRS